ncbi:MAG: TetR family transcriptional regulator [Acidimicrobiia bacterium]|nr:MAG: TetR family transcriptional regulator [Acidimicrobiia bacterium]
MSGDTTLRERKKLRTRRAIEGAALDLFEKQGFDGTTVEDVAAAAEIAPRTFFHYFPSKEDVVLADYAARLDRLVAELEGGPADASAWRALRAAFVAVSADYESERAQMLRRFQIITTAPSVGARSLQLQADWETTVAGIVAGWLGTDPDRLIAPRLLAGAALSAMRASMALWLAGGGKESLPELMARCFDLLDTGLGEINDHGTARP